MNYISPTRQSKYQLNRRNIRYNLPKKKSPTRSFEGHEHDRRSMRLKLWIAHLPSNLCMCDMTRSFVFVCFGVMVVIADLSCNLCLYDMTRSFVFLRFRIMVVMAS